MGNYSPQRSTKNTKSFNKFFFCDLLRSFVVNNYGLWAKPTLVWHKANCYIIESDLKNIKLNDNI